MKIPFGPENLKLKLGSLYKAFGRRSQGYPDEITDLDYIVAAAVLQIVKCHGGVWKNDIIEVGRIEGTTWDNYIVNCSQGCIFSMQESYEGYLITLSSYEERWITELVNEAEDLAKRFGRF